MIIRLFQQTAIYSMGAWAACRFHIHWLTNRTAFL